MSVSLPQVGEMFGLAGRVALVTGGAEGIGAEIARVLAGAGARTMLADINVAGAEAGAIALREAGADAASVAMDLARPDQVEAAVKATVDRFGSLSILVNNAGIQDRAMLLDSNAALFDRLYAVNVRGPLLCLRAAAAAMMASQRGGTIVNIGSLGGVMPLMDGLTVYNSTKAAMHSITRQAALELGGHKIRVNAVLPGPVPTDGSMRSPGPSPKERLMVKLPLPAGRLGTPADVAAATLYLASDAAGFVTGHLLIVDGGMSIV